MLLDAIELVVVNPVFTVNVVLLTQVYGSTGATNAQTVTVPFCLAIELPVQILT